MKYGDIVELDNSAHLYIIVDTKNSDIMTITKRKGTWVSIQDYELDSDVTWDLKKTIRVARSRLKLIGSLDR